MEKRVVGRPRKPVEIDGVPYASMGEAASAMGVKRTTLRYRHIKSKVEVRYLIRSRWYSSAKDAAEAFKTDEAMIRRCARLGIIDSRDDSNIA